MQYASGRWPERLTKRAELYKKQFIDISNKHTFHTVWDKIKECLMVDRISDRLYIKNASVVCGYEVFSKYQIDPPIRTMT